MLGCGFYPAVPLFVGRKKILISSEAIKNNISSCELHLDIMNTKAVEESI